MKVLTLRVGNDVGPIGTGESADIQPGDGRAAAGFGTASPHRVASGESSNGYSNGVSGRLLQLAKLGSARFFDTLVEVRREHWTVLHWAGESVRDQAIRYELTHISSLVSTQPVAFKAVLSTS